jgi:hypothetical protein
MSFLVQDRFKFATRPADSVLGPFCHCPGQQFLLDTTNSRVDTTQLDREIATVRGMSPQPTWDINIEHVTQNGTRLTHKPIITSTLTDTLPSQRFISVVTEAVAYIRRTAPTITLGYYSPMIDTSDFLGAAATAAQLAAFAAGSPLPGTMSQTWLTGSQPGQMQKLDRQVNFMAAFGGFWASLDRIGFRAYLDRLPNHPTISGQYVALLSRAWRTVAERATAVSRRPLPVFAYLSLSDIATGAPIPPDHMRQMVLAAKANADGIVMYGGSRNLAFTSAFAETVTAVKEALA